MTKQQVANLFTDFTKIMDNRDLNKEGVGLGLTISRNIAQALGGDILVQSMVGRGSNFILSLPFIQGPNEATTGCLDANTQKQIIQEDSMNSNRIDSLESEEGPDIGSGRLGTGPLGNMTGQAKFILDDF